MKESTRKKLSDAGKRGAIITKRKWENINSQNETEYYKDPKYCKNCGKILPFVKRESTYCNQSCAATYTNKARGPRSEKTKAKIKKTLESRHDPAKKIKYCKQCGAIKGQCKDSWVCSKFQLFKTLQKFGFDMSVVGTERVVDEFYRVRSIIENFYIINSSNNEKLIELFSYTSGSANFMKILKSLNIESKSHSDAQANAWMLGRIQPVNFEGNYQYECGWHTTWDGNEVYLRSSYEKEYAEELDSKQIKYDVEGLRIKYFDTQENSYRCAIPDFYLPDTNTIVEIKSLWTYDEQNMKDKFKAYKELGYETKLILDHKEIYLKD